MQGDDHTRVWRFAWEKIGPASMHALDDQEPAELLLQWADLLPFAMVVVRVPPIVSAFEFAHAVDGFLESLPGRLGPSNRMPRCEAQLLVVAKISKDRMHRIRDAMETTGTETELRREIAEGLALPGAVGGLLRLESPFGNVLGVESEGVAITTTGASLGPTRAFVFSTGNLAPGTAAPWRLPTWIPPGMGLNAWTFNFHPFLLGATRHANHVAIEAGRLDEQLSVLTRDSIWQSVPGKAQAHLHGKLVLLHRDLQHLRTALHLGITRAPLPRGEETE
ncbi:MAG: hypothetical protein ACT4PT_11745, partial [Methanobacteriota archaeon]